MTGKTYLCERCGITVHGGRNGRYCPECAKEVEKDRKRQYNRTKHGKASQPQGSLSAFAVRARTLGLSYGQFVAKYEVTHDRGTDH